MPTEPHLPAEPEPSVSDRWMRAAIVLCVAVLVLLAGAGLVASLLS
jgi:hypothetical protein